MVSGVVTYRFQGVISKRDVHDCRVLVLNRRDLRQAITDGALAALELVPAHARDWRIEVTDFQRIQFDGIA